MSHDLLIFLLYDFILVFGFLGSISEFVIPLQIKTLVK